MRAFNADLQKQNDNMEGKYGYRYREKGKDDVSTYEKIDVYELLVNIVSKFILRRSQAEQTGFYIVWHNT